MCTSGDGAANGEGIGCIKARHLESREVHVAPSRVLFAFFAFLFAYTCIGDNCGVVGMAPNMLPEQPAESTGGGTKRTIKEPLKDAGSLQAKEAQEEATKPLPAAAPMDTAKQPSKTAKKKAPKQPAMAASTKEAKLQAPEEAPKELVEAAPPKEPRLQLPKDALKWPPEAPPTEPQAPKEAQ